METYNIIVADDDEDDFFIIQEAFGEFSNHELVHVQNGKLLLDVLKRRVISKKPLPDLVLLDINMPKVDGIMALELIKASDDLRSIPIVMYSTSSNFEQRKKCFNLGANGYITKGWTHEKVIAFARNINVFLEELKTLPFKQFDNTRPELILADKMKN